MEKQLIGLDVCDTYTQVCCVGQEKVHSFPTVVCKAKEGDLWLVGQDAYASALAGSGVIVDKLLKLLRKEGTATIAGVRYEGIDLMQKFLERVIAWAVSGEDETAEAQVDVARKDSADVPVGAPQNGQAEEPAEVPRKEQAGAPQNGQAEARAAKGEKGQTSEMAEGESVGERAKELAADAPAEGVPAEPAATASAEDGAATAPAEDAATGEFVVAKPVARKQPTYDSAAVGRLVITVPTISTRLLDQMVACVDRLGIPRNRVHIISHTESFLYYVLSQKREVWNNQVGMFDLSEDFLCYYEMKVQRGMRQVVVMAEREKLDEGFNLDILNTPSGVKLADKILCACGERFLQKKLFSSVFLTGRGFESQDWATDFMKLVCTRRKVYVDQNLFVQGAAFKAADLERDKTAYPYVFICDGRLDTTVSVKVTRRDQEEPMVLAAAGDSWYEAGSTMEFILDHQQYLEFMISPADPKRRKLVRLTLEGFPERDDKTLRVMVQTAFLDENTMAVTVKDMGFGEFYPSTGAVIRQEVML